MMYAVVHLEFPDAPHAEGGRAQLDDAVDKGLLDFLDPAADSRQEQRRAAGGGHERAQLEQKVRVALLAAGEGTDPGEPVDDEQPGLFLHQGLGEQMDQGRQTFPGGAIAAQEQERPRDHRPVEEVEAPKVIDQAAMRLRKQRDDDDPVAPLGICQPALKPKDGLARSGVALDQVQAALKQAAR